MVILDACLNRAHQVSKREEFFDTMEELISKIDCLEG